MSTPVYYDADAELSIVQTRRLAFIGYGNQGAAQAKNLRDSGVREILDEFHLYLLISALKRSVAFLAACAKSSPCEAKMMLREELVIMPRPRLSFPAITVAATSPPCAPMPGMRIGMSPTMVRTFFSSAG